MMSLEITNPYASGTFNSKLFRIPAILTLKNGRVLACSDIRYGNGTDDPANVDVGIRYSDDNGTTWSEPQFVNAFDDMEFADHNKAIPTSASFVDSAIVQGEDGTVYFIDPIIRFKKPLKEILDNYNRNNNSTLGEQIKSAEKEVNTSPTDKQKEAGNYKKGHVQIGTFNITIEQPKGSVRSGVDANGKKSK